MGLTGGEGEDDPDNQMVQGHSRNPLVAESSEEIKVFGLEGTSRTFGNRSMAFELEDRTARVLWGHGRTKGNTTYRR